MTSVLLIHCEINNGGFLDLTGLKDLSGLSQDLIHNVLLQRKVHFVESVMCSQAFRRVASTPSHLSMNYALAHRLHLQKSYFT